MNTGEIILKLLKEQNRTQADLARYLGVSPNTVNRWIPTQNKEGIEPSDYHKIKIADYFDIPVAYITGEYNYWNKQSISEHLFDSVRNETAWLRFLESLGYEVMDSTDYSMSSGAMEDIEEHYKIPYRKQVTIKHGEKETTVNYKQLILTLKRFEKHLAIELDEL